MGNSIIDCGASFYNFRGQLKMMGGLVDIGTQCSLVRRPSGGYVMIDSMELTEAQRKKVDLLTDGGRQIEAVINVHPFHTLHVEWAHKAFPDAKHYGTARHLQMFPNLSWQDVLVEFPAFPPLFSDVLEFTEPKGVILIPEDQNVHFSSILAYHPASQTIHVDDTLSFLDMPFPLSLMSFSGKLIFHPALAKAMEPRAGAADDFRQWAIDMGIAWHTTKRVATAHNGVYRVGAERFPELIGEALGRVKLVLDKHRKEYG